MYSKLLEARLAKLEANPRFGALTSLSDEELDRQIVLGLNAAAADYPSFGAMVSDLRASPSPLDKDLAEGIEGFIAGWQAKAARPATQ